MSKFLELSSRLKNITQKNTVGASCNLYKLEDSCESIAETMAKAILVCYTEGAPAIDYSNLRPEGSPIAEGKAKSGGVTPIVRIHDAIVSSMKRTEKKNSSGLAVLSLNHPDVWSFINEPTNTLYKAVLVPRSEIDLDVAEKLIQAYNAGKCFLVKEPKNGECINLCLEVRTKPDNICILAAHNLALHESVDSFCRDFPGAFVDDMKILLSYMDKAYEKAAEKGIISKVPEQEDKQVGLGVFGLASMLGRFGISYEELHHALFAFSTMYFHEKERHENPAYRIAQALYRGYYLAGAEAREIGIRRAFCIQPTVSTASRSKDYAGYTASPEIQPVVGFKTEESVRSLLVSEIKGNTVLNYHPETPTINEVPFLSYANLASEWQHMMDIDGLAHAHSFNVYGKLTLEFFMNWHSGIYNIESLYYSLPEQVGVDKTNIGGEFAVEFDEAFFNQFLSLKESGCADGACSM